MFLRNFRFKGEIRFSMEWQDGKKRVVLRDSEEIRFIVFIVCFFFRWNERIIRKLGEEEFELKRDT